MNRPFPWAAYACLAGSMALVGCYVGLSRVLVASFPVFLLAWLRFGIAAITMPHWLPRAAGEPRLTPHERWLIFLESFLGNFLFSICMLYGVWLTSAVSAGVVMAAIPAAVAVLSRVFLGERMTRRSMAGTACAVAGIAALALLKPHGGPTEASAARFSTDWPDWVGRPCWCARCSVRPATS
jgi:drug/metabolite transporter (DMT)-like permease